MIQEELEIKNMIYKIREKQVSYIARLYKVETEVFIQYVNLNFIFRLTREKISKFLNIDICNNEFVI